MDLPLNDDAVARLERNTCDAVAPMAHTQLDGWLLAFDRSTIGRATSAVPLRHQRLAVGDLAPIMARYAAQELPAVFRLADLPALAPLHEALYQQGFTPSQPTLVQLAHSADVAALCAQPTACCTPAPTPAWASVYVAPCFDPVDGRHRQQALSRGQHTVYASVVQQGEALSAGTAVYSQGWASLHGLRTVQHARGRGLATDLMAALAREALQRGLPHMYLQVEEDNQAALSLYRRAGFRTAWRYQYWRRKTA
ncbi:GNAT family N-acetyltransferase [uncultured Rhodoferax sp.]|uniref:GNAT family N-acetyltransferase n=1 Tax=uncultured Rhodoferax sp. TaxID=223188 RepID=UPI0025F0E852|nr:GNAT family N-acetyltransferase [uncultured Rhodoferax sp.]